MPEVLAAPGSDFWPNKNIQEEIKLGQFTLFHDKTL